MHINAADLNLLAVAAALYRTRNVSKAAQELGLSQSAVSHALARLRHQFKDPLFVRTSKGVAPTEFARAMQNDLMELVNRAELLINRKSSFDPREARGRITIASTDYMEVTLLSRLIPVLEKEAPHVQLSLRPTVGDLPKRELEEGKIDIAIAGFYGKLPEGFYQTKVGTDTFHCAVREDHPIVKAIGKGTNKNHLTNAEYFAAKHALITLRGDFQDDITDPSSRKKRGREIVYGSYSFTGIAWVLRNSDLILTAPTLLLKRFKEFVPIRIFEPPADLGKIELQMVWHLQTHEDPLRAWFRGVLKKVCVQVFRS